MTFAKWMDHLDELSTADFAFIYDLPDVELRYAYGRGLAPEQVLRSRAVSELLPCRMGESSANHRCYAAAPYLNRAPASKLLVSAR